MPRAIVVYGSTTGNTESVAENIAELISEKGFDVTVKNVTDAIVSELGGNYDITILGSSTWGHEEIEFQEDFEPFFNELGGAELSGKKVALFGCGDSSYEYFCGAVDELEGKMDDLGAITVVPSLRIDGTPDSGETREWAEGLVDALA